MRRITRATIVTFASATAMTTLLAPSAGAAATSAGSITVCVHGPRTTDVEVNRTGPGGERFGTADPCRTFRNLRTGTYLVDIDLSRGWRIGDDDRYVTIHRGQDKRVDFYPHRRHDRRGDDRHRLCPPGQHPVFDNNPATPFCQS